MKKDFCLSCGVKLNSSEENTVCPHCGEEMSGHSHEGTWSVENIRKTHPKAYSKWTTEDEKLLITEKNKGRSTSEIGKLLGRQRGGITSRLKKICDMAEENKNDKMPFQELTGEQLMILFTVSEIENKYSFNLGPSNLGLFLRGGVIGPVKKNNLYIIPTYGLLKYMSSAEVKLNIELLTQNGFLLVEGLPYFYNKPIVKLTSLGVDVLDTKKKLIAKFISEKYKYHVRVVNEKGITHLNFPKDKNSTYKNNDKKIINKEDETKIVRILNEYFTPRQQSIYMMRYGLGEYEPMTLEEVGNQIGVTRERIRQILKKTERKLIRLSRSSIVKDKIANSDKNRNIKVSSLGDKANVSIDELNFSPRTINALRNQNINTVDDLLRKSPKQLRSIRGFGRKAYNQVMENMNELGFLKDPPQEGCSLYYLSLKELLES